MNNIVGKKIDINFSLYKSQKCKAIMEDLAELIKQFSKIDLRNPPTHWPKYKGIEIKTSEDLMKIIKQEMRNPY